MGLFGPPNIEKMKAKRDVDGLIKALSYQKNASVRESAAQALGTIRDARAVEPLIAALRDGDKFMRKSVVLALGQLGDPRAIESLIEALGDENHEVREAAIDVFAKIGGPAVGLLCAALGDRNKTVRKAAVEALDKLGWQPTRDALGAVYWIIKQNFDKCIEIGSPSFEPLLSVLKDNDKELRKSAVRALGNIGDARAVEPLITTLKQANWDIQEDVESALVKIGMPAVKPLIEALKDKNVSVRVVALKSLIEIGDPLAFERLIYALKDEDRNVSLWAVNTLATIGDPRAVEPLIGALNAKNRHVREEAAKALGKTGDPRAVEPLISLFWDQYTDVQEAAVEALVKMGDKRAVEPLIAAFMDKGTFMRRKFADALHEMGWQPGSDEAGVAYCIAREDWETCIRIGTLAVESLIAVVQGENPHLHRGAAEALGKIGDARAVEPLIAILKTEDKDVGKAAVEALGEIGDTRAVEPLSSMLEDIEESARLWATQDQKDEIRLLIANALARIDDPRVIEPMVHLLMRRDFSRRDGEIIHIAGETLYGFGSVVAPLLLAELSKQEGMFHERVMDLLVRIGGDQVIEFLAFKLEKEDLSPFNADSIILTLGKLGDANVVPRLVGLLSSDRRHIRPAAAEILVSLFKSNKLDSQTRQLILSQRDRIVSTHTDIWNVECQVHADEGIGVNFPL